MPSIRSFRGYLVAAERVHEVVSPAYDALTPQQRHEYALEHPQNYVNVMRSQDEFPQDECPDLGELLQTNKDKLTKLLDGGAFREIQDQCLFIYRLRVDDHEQTGLVAEVPIKEYQDGVIKKHEHTHSHKEDQLVRYNEVVGAASSPVCLAYTHHPKIDTVIKDWMSNTDPVIDFVSEDEVEQTLWCIDDVQAQGLLRDCFQEIEVTYLTDGHHRAEAGLRYADIRHEQNPNHTGEEDYNFLLVALFPDEQLRILPYNRCVRDLNGLSPSEFLNRLTEKFDIELLGDADPEAAEPETAGQFGMLLEGNWYRLKVHSELIPENDPVESLDVSILHHQVLDPILGITDMRSDPRCRSIAGALGMQGLIDSCGEGVGFACYPTSIQQLMAVADASRVMPPKSTWFDPKVRSGLFLQLR